MSAEYMGRMFDAQCPPRDDSVPHVWVLQRYNGKPTSGRYVYKSQSGWHWQCDMCERYEYDFSTWKDAIFDALTHTYFCNNISTSNRVFNEHPL